MGAMTIISSLVLVAMIVWGSYTFLLVQFNQVRQYNPHYEYDEVINWPYNINWTGGRTNWFQNVNYTNFNLNDFLPEDLLNQLNGTVFFVSPEDPPQLWRSTSYDSYDGSGWSKTSFSLYTTLDQILITDTEAQALNTTVYRVYLNVTAGPGVGSIELPTLFPEIFIIEDSFETGEFLDGSYISHDPSRLISYDLEYDDYGSVLFSPLIEGVPNSTIIVSYEVTYSVQDLLEVANRALDGFLAPPSVSPFFTDLSAVLPLSDSVRQNITPFVGTGNAYELAFDVESYFRTTFELMIENYNDRPSSDQEVTDWFLERGGGLPMDFVTAYCVFMRYLGVPARPALGYSVGTAMGGYRAIQVRHMMFWAEVFIPMLGHSEGGEWIQVIPIPLPGELGGGEIPENTGAQNAELLIAPLLAEPWALIGDPFDLVATLFIDFQQVTTPEIINFYDEGVYIGSKTIDASGFATFTYAFPSGSTLGVHNISATWSLSTFTVMNYTYVSAVDSPNPMMVSAPSEPIQTQAEIIELDIRLGLDNYTVHWNDTVRVHGRMTDSQGQPIDGTTLINDQMEIIWDGVNLGNATIQFNGTYSYDAYVDPFDAVLMSPGPHEVWSYYGGEIDPDTGFYKYFPNRSEENSTVTIIGLALLNLYISPTPAYRGAMLHYEGYLELMNGTPLPFESVNLYLNNSHLGSRITNSTAHFEFDYLVPSSYPLGQVEANVTWLSTVSGISDCSEALNVTIGMRPVDLTMFSIPEYPDPVHLLDDIIIYGWLTDGVNGTGLMGRTVDIWWDNGLTLINIGSNATVVGGYYEFVYNVPLGYEGLVSYWSNYTSPDTVYEDKKSTGRSIKVKLWDSTLTIQADPDPVYVLGTFTIQGNLFLPEWQPAPLPLAGETVDIWWHNSTGIYKIQSITTNVTGGYLCYFEVPLNHEHGNATLFANCSISSANVRDAESNHLYPVVDSHPTTLTVYSGSSIYHLNETAYIYGRLLNSTEPLSSQTIYIYWRNSTHTLVFTSVTNVSGYYTFYYPLSLTDGPDTVNVYVNFTSPSHAYSNASATLVPSLTLQLYQLNLTVNPISAEYHLNETLSVSGTLSFQLNGNPIPGATIAVHYYWQNGTELVDYAMTNGFGVFNSQYDFTLTDALGAIYVWTEYTASNSLWENATSGTQQANVVLYTLEINASVPSAVYLDQGVLIDGFLTFLGGSPPLSSETVNVYIASSATGQWALIASPSTDGTGYFYHTHFFTVPGDTEGTYYFKCNYTSTDPLNANATTSALPVVAQRYAVTLVVAANPNPVYQNETLAIHIHLYYTIGGLPIDGVFVDLFWYNGTEWPLDTVVTNTTGEFTFYYSEMDYDTLRTGIEIYGRYAGNLTLDSTESVHDSLTLLQWQTEINGFSVGSTSYYILQTLSISGSLLYSINLAPVASGTIELLFDGSPVAYGITSADGSFSITWQIPESTTPSTHSVSARYTPLIHWISGNTATSIDVDIMQYVVNLTADVDTSMVYRGGSVIISGTLQFDDGTPMVGYDVEIHWDNGTDTILQTITIVDTVSGNFSHVHAIDWSHPVGISQYYVVFVRPSLAFEEAATPPADIEVWDLVALELDTQTIFMADRGDTITISGIVWHGGFPAHTVSINILENGNPIDSIVTGTDGRFSVDLLVPDDAAPGSYNITIDVPAGSFFERSGVPTPWFITVSIDTVLFVSFPRSVEIQPGENFTLVLRLQDADGHAIHDAELDVYLNDTFLLTLLMAAADWADVEITVPLSWAASGRYVVSVEYDGDTELYLRGTTAETPDSMHIFCQVVFDFGRTPRRVSPGLEFTVSAELTDDQGIAIANRRVEFNLNGTDTVIRQTDTSGIATFPVAAIQNPADFTFSVTLLSQYVENISSIEFTVQIREPEGGFLDTLDFLVPFALLGAAIVVIFIYIYFMKGYGRGKSSLEDGSISQRLRNIKKLADAGKFSAAINLAYHTFEALCGTKIGSERRLSETARDFVTRTLEQIPLDLASVSELLEAYEEARFSDHEVSRSRYENTMRVLTDLYPRIEAVVVITE